MANIIKLYAAYKAGFLGNNILDTYFSFMANMISEERLAVVEDTVIAAKFKYVLSLKKSRNPPKHSQQIISGQGQRQSTFVVDCLSLFMCKSNSNTICVEVVYVTSAQLAAK